MHTLAQTLRQQTAELKAAIKAANSSKSTPSNHSPSSPSKSANSSPSTGSSTPPSSGNSGGSGGSGSGGSGSGGSGSGSGGSGNGGGGSATAVLGTLSTKLVVTVDLGASLQSEATIGEKVTVEMPDGSTQNGKVTAVSPVAQSSSSSANGGSSGGGDGSGGSGSSSGATVPVTIELDNAARGGGLDQASVSVNFVQNKARNVLSVPVTALLATSGSTFAVQAASSPHKLIPVKTGLFAAGYVEISGAGIHSGLRVTDSQG